jgi:transcriptional regulator with XRE-family HTH domain
MTHESLALKLRVLRAERALTIEEAARQAGVTPETISDAERGRRRPYLPTLRKVAAAYGVPVSELLAEEAQEPVLAGKADAPSPGPADSPKISDPLDGWIGRALSEGDFARDFERAKDSQDLADELRRAKDAEVTERNQAVATLRKRNAPPAEILEAQRDRVVSNAQLTAAAFLAVELWRGHDVSGTDPRSIVADVVRNQRELLLGGRRDEGGVDCAGREERLGRA